ncbi:MAG: hypothetical protein H6502_03790 [Candidatus Woesearchaeota archaeon]|nr:MAG: hypothetical protein H6502_03790 [Candidatus Woesearchaeota archaeon]
MEDLEGLSTKEKLELLRKRRQRVEKEAEERIQKEKEDEEKQLKAIEELLARTEKEAREELEERLRESASEAPLDALEEELMQQTHEDYEQKKPEEPPVVAYNEEGFGTQDKYAPLTSGGSVGDFLSLRKESQYRSLSVEEQSFVSLMSYHVNVSNAEFLGSQKQGGIEELASYATPTLNVEVLRMVDAPKQNDVYKTEDK